MYEYPVHITVDFTIPVEQILWYVFWAAAAISALFAISGIMPELIGAWGPSREYPENPQYIHAWYKRVRGQLNDSDQRVSNLRVSVTSFAVLSILLGVKVYLLSRN